MFSKIFIVAAVLFTANVSHAASTRLIGATIGQFQQVDKAHKAMLKPLINGSFTIDLAHKKVLLTEKDPCGTGPIHCMMMPASFEFRLVAKSKNELGVITYQAVGNLGTSAAGDPAEINLQIIDFSKMRDGTATVYMSPSILQFSSASYEGGDFPVVHTSVLFGGMIADMATAL